MKDIMNVYQGELKDLGLSGLNIHAVPHPRSEPQGGAVGMGEYVGSKACKDCHVAAYKVWAKSAHAKAYDTLVKADVPRNYDPECISCHVVGWHPTEHVPYKSGFLGQKETPHLTDVGCESCHGPGGAHADAEVKADLVRQKALQAAMRITAPGRPEAEAEKTCITCHDGDNSPEFNFKTYWPYVKHSEK
jgi:hypothetical protein